MTKINLPSDILQKETFKSLPAKEKEEYIKNLLMKVLELNPEGITISQIRETTGLNYSTLWHHLEVLSSTAQGNKVSKGNVDIYFPNSNMVHLNDYDKGSVRYSVSTIKNAEGSFICIQEKRENRSGNYAVCKGITIPIELVDNFTSSFGKINKAHLNGNASK